METRMTITVKNLDKVEDYASEILRHVAAINEINKRMAWDGTVRVEAEMEDEKAASGN